MKRLRLAVIVLAPTIVLAAAGAEQSTVSGPPRFKYERFDAQSGALFDSKDGHSSYNNSLRSVFVDSKGRVWAGTVTGLAVYDGERWSSRSFPDTEKGMLPSALRGLAGSDFGPNQIAEGPPGTVWFADSLIGIWRHRDGRYEQIDSKSLGYILHIAVDHEGALWVVTKYNVKRYDGKTWTTVLCPYFNDSIHREIPGLFGIAVGTNGSVWIGGTAYTEPTAPWTHEGPTWLVDQQSRKRNDGPPMAAVFEFNGQRWNAFGPPHGLDLGDRGHATPQLDGLGRIQLKTPKGRFIREGETWKRIEEPDVSRGKQWVLKERNKGRLSNYYAQVCYREGDKLVEVRATDHKTGELLDLESASMAELEMAEDKNRDCIWLGTFHGLYKIWRDKPE